VSGAGDGAPDLVAGNAARCPCRGQQVWQRRAGLAQHAGLRVDVHAALVVKQGAGHLDDAQGGGEAPLEGADNAVQRFIS
jgi:hypothetical protein